MSDSAKKLTTLDDLVQGDHVDGLKSLIVASPTAYPPEELFEVRIGESRLGPIWNQDLKAYVAQDPNFPVSCFVSQFATDDWLPLVQHPFFQRRRPQLVARGDLNIEKESFYILREGKKAGPYSSAQVLEKLAKDEVMVSDQISSDGGHSWGRLYEIEEFDRRNIVSSSELPFMPEWQVFNNSFDEVEQGLGEISHDSKSIETDAIASLAYLENLQSGKAGYTQGPKLNAEAHSTGPLPRAVLAVVVAIGLGLALAAWYASRPEPVTTQSNQVDNAKAVRPTAVKAVAKPVPAGRLGQDAKHDDTPFSQRMLNNVKRAPRAPANQAQAFRKSRTFKKQTQQNDFTYDDDRPLEQDPIGSKLSRESVNPNNEYQQELRDEGYDNAEPDYANDRFGGDTQQSEDNFAKLYENDGSNVGESGAVDQVNDDAYDAY